MGMGGMRGSGMMGGMDRGADNQSAAPGPHMAQGMMQHHELMSKRMDMMHVHDANDDGSHGRWKLSTSLAASRTSERLQYEC